MRTTAKLIVLSNQSSTSSSSSIGSFGEVARHERPSGPVGGALECVQLELEELDANNPSVDHSAWLNVQIVEHTLDIACIDFDSKIFDTNDVKSVGLKGTQRRVYLDFGLGVARFSFIPSDGTKAAQVSLVIRTKLRENETSGDAR